MTDKVLKFGKYRTQCHNCASMYVERGKYGTGVWYTPLFIPGTDQRNPFGGIQDT